MPKIRATVATARRANPSARAYLDRIEALAGEGPISFREAMLTLTDAGRVLRSCSPRAGISSQPERQRVLRATRGLGAVTAKGP